MKEIGVNTIERTMPGVYDKTLNKILEEANINLVPRFRILANPEVIDNAVEMQKQKETILSVVKENLGKKHIIAWNIGEDVLYGLANQTYQPDYFYYEQKYLTWLSDVCDKVRALDSTRPIVMDLHWDARGKKRFQFYKNHVPQINTYMLEADSKYPQGLKEPLEAGMAWGKVGVEMWPLVPAIKYAGIIPSWQDIENTDYINLNGLLDLEGRKKEDYKTVVNTWGNKSAGTSPIPDIKILKPAKVTYEKTSLAYRLLISNGKGGWIIYNNDLPGIHIEWYLVRVDQYRNTMFIKKKGEGANIALSIPKDPQFYRLYAEAVMGDETKYTFENLNIPLE